jgi:predicted Zn-dependent protease
MNFKMRSRTVTGLGLLAACAGATVLGIGCVENTGGAMSSIGSVLPGVPGVDSTKTQQAMQVGAKVLDRADLESPQRQEEIGQSVAVAITNRYPLSTDQTVNDYVNLVGLTIASVSRNPETNYCFGVLETPEVAAYSAPGGYIFITRGALSLCRDEAELAGVLAHEAAHVALNHGINAVKNAKDTDILLTGAKTQSEAVAQFGQLVDAAVDVTLVKGYSRAQESEADKEAVKYLIDSGYDPAGLRRFLERMQASTGTGGGLMSTHPGTPERIAAVSKQIGTHAGGAALAERFAANVK